VRSSCDIVARKFDFSRSSSSSRATARDSRALCSVSSANVTRIASSWVVAASSRA
jgi:hypothetical protein